MLLPQAAGYVNHPCASKARSIGCQHQAHHTGSCRRREQAGGNRSQQAQHGHAVAAIEVEEDAFEGVRAEGGVAAQKTRPQQAGGQSRTCRDARQRRGEQAQDEAAADVDQERAERKIATITGADEAPSPLPAGRPGPASDKHC
jgi:hypothetical protein